MRRPPARLRHCHSGLVLAALLTCHKSQILFPPCKYLLCPWHMLPYVTTSHGWVSSQGEMICQAIKANRWLPPAPLPCAAIPAWGSPWRWPAGALLRLWGSLFLNITPPLCVAYGCFQRWDWHVALVGVLTNNQPRLAFYSPRWASDAISGEPACPRHPATWPVLCVILWGVKQHTHTCWWCLSWPCYSNPRMFPCAFLQPNPGPCATAACAHDVRRKKMCCVAALLVPHDSELRVTASSGPTNPASAGWIKRWCHTPLGALCLSGGGGLCGWASGSYRAPGTWWRC